MLYLSAEDILAVHDRVIEETGGSLGVREHGLLRSIAERPKTAFAGQEQFRDVFAKAAAYLEAIATYHVFIDGNKRTAISVAAVFLALNRYQIRLQIEPSEKFMLAVEKRRYSFEEITAWLKRHSKKTRQK